MSMASFLLAALVLAALAATTATASLNGLPGCQTRCGEVDIPYPFGFGNSVSTSGANYSRPGFEIACVKKDSGGLMPVLGNTQTQIQVLNLFVTPRPEARVMLPVAYQCYNSSGYTNGNMSYAMVVVNPAGVYRISNSSNELFVLGCNTFIYTNSGPRGRSKFSYYTGCVAYCNDSRSAQDGACAGIGCCHVDIPPGLTDNWMEFNNQGSWSHADQEFSPCDYAFIVEKGHYTFRASDLTGMPLNQTMPLRLDWAIRDSTDSAMSLSCASAPKSPGYTCVSAHSECVNSTNGPGYVCNCTKGYEGNPYLVNGCTTTASLNGLPGCQTRCGEVDIPYPFGFGANCSRPGFEIACVKNGSGGLMPVLGDTQTQIQVLNLSATPPEARVMVPVAYQCYNLSGYTNGNMSNGTFTVNPASVYRISNSSNELFVLGCTTFVYTNSKKGSGRYGYTYYFGCVAYANDSRSAQDGVCSGVGCCHVNIPAGLTDNWMYFSDDSDWMHADLEFYCPCDYAFIVEKGNYTFRASDLTSMPLNQTMPLRLDWAIRDSTGSAMSLSCANAPKSPGYTCVSAQSECVNSINGPGYFCICTKGYEGNPYLVNGCANIIECARPQEFPCNGVCHDTEGSYDCKCRPGYWSVNDDAKENPCNPNFPPAARLALGITLGVSFLIVALLLALLMLQKRRLDELFEKNGGKVLQKVKGLTIFTREELKKITKNNSEFLGKGSFGNVHKGTLPDGTMVAVKASIEVNEATKAEFTKEVEIQTQMIHKNILKLFGCCLEVDVPMLVYEFAAKGSLQDILHGKKIHELPLDMRLDIAIGSAEGLRYMHSYATQAIRHGDVKPDNILLDDTLIPKISDFGLSKMLNVAEYFTKIVVGCMGYIDPVFMKTGLLTQKSDVYSFGAVLLELITRKQNVYDENCSLIIEFRKVYEKEKSGRAMFDKEIIATEEDIFILEQIGKLAMECLKEDVADRPDMTEVAEQLVMIRRDRKHGMAPKSPRHFEDIAAVDDSPKSFATDITISGTTSTATFSVPSTPTNKDFSANP